MAGKRTPRTSQKATANDWAPRLLVRLAQTANIKAACLAAGVGRTTFYQRRDSDPEFAAAAAAALDDAVDDLEMEARRRAHDGTRRVKFHQGQPIMIQSRGPDGSPLFDDKGEPVLAPYTEHEYSDTLMIFLLKAHRPEKYRERYDVSHGGHVGLEHSGEIKGRDDHIRAAASALLALGLVPGGSDDLAPAGSGDPAGEGTAPTD